MLWELLLLLLGFFFVKNDQILNYCIILFKLWASNNKFWENVIYIIHVIPTDMYNYDDNDLV